MKTELKNLRVAVVPTETGNGIDQRSSVEEVLVCSETEIYALTDYFQAQNDEELGLHWSFLIDMVEKEDLTGTNMDGIHYFDKAQKIDRITTIISTWGSTSCAELNRDHSPCKSSIGNGKQNVSELIEEFFSDHVSAVTYNDEVEIGWNDYSYVDLEDYLIDEILEIVEEYEADMLKTEKRCEN